MATRCGGGQRGSSACQKDVDQRKIETKGFGILQASIHSPRKDAIHQSKDADQKAFNGLDSPPITRSGEIPERINRANSLRAKKTPAKGRGFKNSTRVLPCFHLVGFSPHELIVTKQLALCQLLGGQPAGRHKRATPPAMAFQGGTYRLHSFHEIHQSDFFHG